MLSELLKAKFAGDISDVSPQVIGFAQPKFTDELGMIGDICSYIFRMHLQLLGDVGNF